MRIWSISEQVYVEPNTRLRFEFTSAHTESMAAGEGPTLHDNFLMLNVYNESGNRVIRMKVSRGGIIASSEVENVDQPPESDAVQEERVTRAETWADAAQAHDGAGQEVKADGPVASDGGLNSDFERINYADQFAGDIS